MTCKVLAPVNGPPALRHNQDTWLALRIALKHDQVAGDPEVVCSIAQACRDWRAAVKALDAGLLKIELDGWRSKPADLEKFVALGSWIKEFPGSIGSLDIRGPPFSEDHEFRTAAESALADSIAQAAAGPLVKERPCSRQLKLQSLVSRNLGGERLLSALPAAYLVQLELHVPHPAGDPHSGNNNGSGDARWLAAVRQLSNLQQLQLSSASDILPLGTLAAIQTLLHLTYLNLKDVDVGDAADLQMLPVQLKQLKMGLTASSWTPPAQFQLQHLTQLQLLKLGMADFDILPGSQLPPNITTLKMTCSFVQAGADGVYPLLQHINIAGLCKLQELRLIILDDAESWSLDPLLTMKQLTTVTLTCKYLIGAADSAPAWGSVPALQHLKLSNGHGDEQLDEVNFTNLMEGIGAATALTSLDIDFADSDGLPDGRHLRLCSYMTGLSNLRKLQLTFKGCDALSSRDMLHLTALTGVTKLRIAWATSPALDGLTAVALACHLTNLVCLELLGCDSECLAAIPAIALHLTRLEFLDLTDMEALDDSSFMMLTSLRKLKRFSPHYHEERGPSKEAWETFWEKVRA